MSVFFNGRLWTSPATMSVVDDSAMNNRNLTVGNVVALVGRSAGGQPNIPLRFGSPDQAKAVLGAGELLDAVIKAFDPSAQTNGPSEVVAVRVNPALQSALTLLDTNSQPAINLVSSDYGLRTNQIKVKIEAGTDAGLKLTSQLGQEFYTEDNVARKAFSIRYTGPAVTAVMNINGTDVVLQAPSGTVVASIDLSTYPTVEQLVDRINTVAGFSAAVLDSSETLGTINGLDYITSMDVKTAEYRATANLQAAVNWFNGNGEGFVTATRAPNAGLLPTPTNFTYLSGGSDGTTTIANWATAYTTLQSVDVQWVVPISADPAIWAMNDSHCAFASNVLRMERRGLVGTGLATSDASAIAAAKALNSDRSSLVHIGFYDYDAAGKLVLKAPYLLAALLAGAFAGSNPGTAMTNKTVKVRGLERKLRNPTDTDQLINGGVLCVEETNEGFKVVKSITTWSTNRNYNRVEVSTGTAGDFVARNVRMALDALRGEKATPLILARAKSIADSALRELARAEPQGPGVIAGDAENPAYKNITASIEGDVLRVSFQASLVIPVNYIPVTIYAVPYSGSVTG